MHPMVTPVKKKTLLTPTVMVINKVTTMMRICHQMAQATVIARKKSKRFLLRNWLRKT